MKKNKEQVKKRGSRGYRVIYFLFSGIVGFLLGIKVINPQNEPTEGKHVVCANHASACDPVVISFAFRKNQLRYMAKKELFKIPLLSSLIRMLGAFPIDRGGSDVGAIRNAVSIVEQGGCLGIFPQGHRYPGKNPRDTKTKNGAMLIAARAEADIVPVYIWRKNNRLRLFRRTYVIIGETIPFSELNYNKEANSEYARMTNIVFDRICQLGEEFSKTLEQKKKK